MDRKREAQEDQVCIATDFFGHFFRLCVGWRRNNNIFFSFQSIKERLEQHTAQRDEELIQQTPTKLSKKEKKKQKESKKLAKQKKLDLDKVINTAISHDFCEISKFFCFLWIFRVFVFLHIFRVFLNLGTRS